MDHPQKPEGLIGHRVTALPRKGVANATDRALPRGLLPNGVVSFQKSGNHLVGRFGGVDVASLIYSLQSHRDP